MAILGRIFILPRKLQILAIGIEALIFVMCAPYQGKRVLYIRTKWLDKALTLLVFIVGLGLGWKLGENYFNNLIVVAGVTALMIIEKPESNLS